MPWYHGRRDHDGSHAHNQWRSILGEGGGRTSLPRTNPVHPTILFALPKRHAWHIKDWLQDRLKLLNKGMRYRDVHGKIVNFIERRCASVVKGTPLLDAGNHTGVYLVRARFLRFTEFS